VLFNFKHLLKLQLLWAKNQTRVHHSIFVNNDG
jgi:hypothetical protein